MPNFLWIRRSLLSKTLSQSISMFNLLATHVLRSSSLNDKGGGRSTCSELLLGKFLGCFRLFWLVLDCFGLLQVVLARSGLFWLVPASSGSLLLLQTKHTKKIEKCDMCMLTLCPYLFSNGRGRTSSLSSAFKTNQTDFTDWMSYLSSNVMEKTSPNTEVLYANT